MTVTLQAPQRSRLFPTARSAVSTILWAAWLPILIVVLWWIGSMSSKSTFFPPLSTILARTGQYWFWQGIHDELLPSLTNFAVGYFGAIVVGVLVATLLARRPRLTRTVSPVVYFLYVLPAPALLPAVILLFGIGPAGKMFIIFFASVWPVLLNSLDGLRGVDSLRLDVARIAGMSRLTQLWRVSIPSAIPQIFAGARVALQFGVILMVVSEFQAATQGVGYFILFAQQTYQIVDMWSGMIVLGVVGSVLSLAFVLVERRVLNWHYQSRTSAT